MENLVKDADVVVCDTISAGKLPLGFMDNDFKKLGPFLEVADDYDAEDIKGVYMYIDGELKVVPVKKFRSLYKAIKNVS